MTPEKPAVATKAPIDYLFWWLSPIILLILGAFCWSNHFDAGFHRDDFPNIVNNRHVRDAETFPLISSPLAYSEDMGHADFRPLLALLFAVDFNIKHDGSPSIFQMSTFLWFLPLPFLIYLMARLLPGAKHLTALFTAILFAVHPIVSDTLNYISRRGELIAAGAVVAAMVVWVAYPDRLPLTLGIDLYRIPKTWWQEFTFNNGKQMEAWYKIWLRGPRIYYFLPLVVGVLCSPATTAFAAVGAAWLWVYPPKEISGKWKRLYPGVIFCGAWLLLHTVLTWRYLAPLRAPALQYWLGQPRVAVQYFIWFFTPFNMSADAGLLPELRFWPPEILLGIIGTGALVFIAIKARKHELWRPMAFGIAWFLAAQIPFALVPQTSADSGARMFVPSIGLALAVGHVLMLAVEKAQERESGALPLAFGLSTSLLVLLAVMGWLTFERNKVWESDRTLWMDTVNRSPGNQRALVNYAWEMINFEDLTTAAEYANRADKAAPQDAHSEVLVAKALDRMGVEDRAEFHYKRAIEQWPQYAGAMSSYGTWLVAHQRYAEGTDWSEKALRLNYRDNVARGNLMDTHSAAFEWEAVNQMARQALDVEPDNARAKLGLAMSEDALNRVSRAEKNPDGTATSDDYLTLSVAYFRAKRYEDCVTTARKALKIKDDLAEAHSNIATCLHAMARDEEAITELREVVRLRPDMRVAQVNLWILEEDQRKKRATVK